MNFENIQLGRAIQELLAQEERKPQYPEDHKPGMAVPKGGSSCESCEYYKGDMKCGSEYFIKWNGSDKIPAESPDEYCSDWYEPKADDETSNDN